ncbi:branched-chain amino acid ABC transporter permease [Dictyobacter kobayashii]|uniref:Branched-chain amino acid ABC transporter permease n=1 Tax=Dictyobacter kobayashii TaxID=2014872 RepID=A0A402AHG2_9CHLR|nr:branched-chain amino acid ABC transporter permease [Dictyobacter kobayashii]GCE18550.1 branched-chain amino acid ABC transporter permease [Dictyobacter kobayashii]
MTQKPAMDQEIAPVVAAQPEPPRENGLIARLSRQRGWLASIIGLLVLILLPTLYDQIFGFSSGFQLHHLSLIGIFILAALAQNILTGYAAQPALGNAAFFGVSAYMLTWLSSDLGQPYWVGILVAVLVSALLGLVVGAPALRISGAHLAVATLGLVTTVGALLNFWDTTAGRQNYDLSNLPDFLNEDHTLYYFVFAIVVILLFLSYHLLHSRVGRAWVAIRDNETAAEAFGINLTKYKLQAFVISAAMTGLAGSLYATWATTASSSMSSVDQTIAFLAMIVVGGLGSLTGSILGAIFVGFLPLLLGQLPSPLTIGSFQLQISTLLTGIYGLLLLLVLIFFPSGLSSLGTRVGSLLQRNHRGEGRE